MTRSKEEIFGSVAEEMLARDPRHQKLWVCVMDGGKALRRVARKVPGALGPLVLILDLFHVLEYLWDTANALHGKATCA